MSNRTRKPVEDRAGVDTVWVSFRIDAEVADKLDKIAREQDRSRAAVIRRFIVKNLEELQQTA
jgi:predicted transcriptional regulator